MGWKYVKYASRLLVSLIELVAAVACLWYAGKVRGMGDGTAWYFIEWIIIGVLLAVTVFFRWPSRPLKTSASSSTSPSSTSSGGKKKGFHLHLSAVSLLWLVFILLYMGTAYLVSTNIHTPDTPDLDFIIVTGGLYDSNAENTTIEARLDKAASYLQENPDTICIIESLTHTGIETLWMKWYLTINGISESRIVRDYTSDNTKESAINSKKIIKYMVNRPDDAKDPDGDDDGPINLSDALSRSWSRFEMPSGTSVGIVTNDYNITRAVAIAKRWGFTNVVGIGAPTERQYLPDAVLREMWSYIGNLISGNFRL